LGSLFGLVLDFIAIRASMSSSSYRFRRQRVAGDDWVVAVEPCEERNFPRLVLADEARRLIVNFNWAGIPKAPEFSDCKLL
jgi:hypothetical protein